MRRTLLIIFAGLLLPLLGCASPQRATVQPVAPIAVAAPRSTTPTPAAIAPAVPTPTSRDAMPGWAIPYQKKLVVGVVTKQRAVALTIDDVGGKEMRPLVDALVASDLHATLFCVGSKMTTEAATYAAANGMELADHSWNHKSIGWYGPLAANEQIMRTARLLRAGTGSWPIWYRSPFQLYHSQGMRAVAGAGMAAAGVSNDPLDYRGYTGAPLVARVSQALKPGQIILLHHYPQTIATFPALAKELRRRDVEVLTLSELAQLGHPATSLGQLEPFAGTSEARAPGRP
jgi:peptidoglycan/xylan/chitin deacetylase (PgdA/CDA1 family)